MSAASGESVDIAIQSLEKARRAGWARAYEGERLRRQLEAELGAVRVREQLVIDVARALLSSDRADVAKWFLWLGGSDEIRNRWQKEFPFGNDPLLIARRLSEYFDAEHPLISED